MFEKLLNPIQHTKSPIQADLNLLPHRFQVDFAIFCAFQVKDKWKHIPVACEAVRMAQLWLDGKATSEQCYAAYAVAYAAHAAAYAAHAAAYAAYAAAYAAAAYAAYAAAAAANAAAHAAAHAAAANAAVKQKAIDAQWEHYNYLLTFDDMVEQILLIGK